MEAIEQIYNKLVGDLILKPLSIISSKEETKCVVCNRRNYLDAVCCWCCGFKDFVGK